MSVSSLCFIAYGSFLFLFIPRPLKDYNKKLVIAYWNLGIHIDTLTFVCFMMKDCPMIYDGDMVVEDNIEESLWGIR
jgi:hypothetical protein